MVFPVVFGEEAALDLLGFFQAINPPPTHNTTHTEHRHTQELATVGDKEFWSQCSNRDG